MDLAVCQAPSPWTGNKKGKQQAIPTSFVERCPPAPCSSPIDNVPRPFVIQIR